MRVINRAKQGFFLVIAAMLTDRAGREQFFVELVPILKPARRHSTRRTNGARCLIGEGDVERAVFAAEKASGGERFQFLTLTVVEALTDVDERGHRRILRPKGSRQHCAEMRRSDRLWRCVARVPLILMPRVQYVAEITCGVTAYESSAIHHCGHLLQTFRKPDAVYRSWNAWEGAEERIGRHSFRERRVAFRIERLCGCHPAAHPQHDHRISGGLDFLQLHRGGNSRETCCECGKGRGACGLQEVAT